MFSNDRNKIERPQNSQCNATASYINQPCNSFNFAIEKYTKDINNLTLNEWSRFQIMFLIYFHKTLYKNLLCDNSWITLTRTGHLPNKK